MSPLNPVPTDEYVPAVIFVSVGSDGSDGSDGSVESGVSAGAGSEEHPANNIIAVSNKTNKRFM